MTRDTEPKFVIPQFNLIGTRSRVLTLAQLESRHLVQMCQVSAGSFML
jgi:hypothetical protein